MEAPNQLDRVDVAVLLLLAAAVVLAVQAVTRRTAGFRVLGVLVLPVVVAVLLAGSVLLLRGRTVADLRSTLLATPASIAIGAAALLIALALVDLVFDRAVPLLMRASRRAGRPLTPDVALLVVLAPAVAGATALSLVPRPAPAPAWDRVASLVAFDLPSQPMDLVLDGPSRGYLTFRDGSLARFELPHDGGGDIRIDILAHGLHHPRGVIRRDDELIVAELGELPCEPSVVVCTGWTLRGADPVQGELEILASARARIVSFPLLPDGDVGSPRVLLSDLPVATGEHGVNGLTLGADGAVYVPVGSVDLLWEAPDRASGVTPNEEWLGTVLRLPPEGGAPQVFARGLRNVYQVTFDDRGDMWAIDNDGPTLGGWRGEEVLQVKEGRHYGYPREGTFGEHAVRDDMAVWLIDQLGSAGIAWSQDVGLGPGLLIGSCGLLSHLPLAEVGGRRAPFNPSGDGDVSAVSISAVSGCVTAIETADDTLLAAVFDYSGGGSLLRIRFR